MLPTEKITCVAFPLVKGGFMPVPIDVLPMDYWNAHQVMFRNAMPLEPEIWFITSYGHVIDCKEARKVAIMAGQVENTVHKDKLSSTDIWKPEGLRKAMEIANER